MSLSRRDFLARTAAVTAVLPAAGLAAPSSMRAGGVREAVIDADLAGAGVFARALRQAGVTPETFRGDITRLWSQCLQARWRQTPAMVAGLTGRECFSCLSMLAAGHGLYPLVTIEHRRTRDARVEHVLQVPANLVTAAESLRTTADWRRTTARLLAAMPARAGSGGNRRVSVFSAATGDDIETVAVSWILIPTRKALSARRRQVRSPA